MLRIGSKINVVGLYARRLRVFFFRVSREERVYFPRCFSLFRTPAFFRGLLAPMWDPGPYPRGNIKFSFPFAPPVLANAPLLVPAEVYIVSRVPRSFLHLGCLLFPCCLLFSVRSLAANFIFFARQNVRFIWSSDKMKHMAFPQLFLGFEVWPAS